MSKGYLTTEFWISLASTAVMVLLSTGVITPSGAAEINRDVQVVATALAALIPAVYSIGRTLTKRAAIAAGLVK